MTSLGVSTYGTSVYTKDSKRKEGVAMGVEEGRRRGGGGEEPTRSRKRRKRNEEDRVEEAE